MKSLIEMYKNFGKALILHLIPLTIIMIGFLIAQLFGMSASPVMRVLVTFIIGIGGIIIFYKKLDDFVDLDSELGAFVNLIYNIIIIGFIIIIFNLPSNDSNSPLWGIFGLGINIIIFNFKLSLMTDNLFFIDIPRSIYLLLLLLFLPVIAFINSLLADKLWSQVDNFEV